MNYFLGDDNLEKIKSALFMSKITCIPVFWNFELCETNICFVEIFAFTFLDAKLHEVQFILELLIFKV